MKKILVSLTCLVLAISVIAFMPKQEKTVFAESEKIETSIIEVIGTGEVKVTPDTAIINVGVETIAPTATEAETENKQKINAIINVLLDNGVERNKIQTLNYYMFKKYDYQNGQTFLGYQISNTLEFSTSLNDELSNLITTLTNAGVTNINGLRFVASNKNELYNRALKVALDNASIKAKALALGNNLEILDVKECNNCCDVEIARYVSLSSVQTQIEKGEVIIKASVKVKFKIV